MSSVTEPTQRALLNALDRPPSADAWPWAPPPAGYVRRHLDAVTMMDLVRDVRPVAPRLGATTVAPILAQKRPDGTLTIIDGAPIAAFLLRARCRSVPVWIREPGARVPAASLDPLDALNLLVVERDLPPAYRAALRRRVDVGALPWLAISDAWAPEQINPARARTLVAEVEPGPLVAPLRRPMVVDVGGRDVIVGGADTLAAMVAAGVSPLSVWREK